MADASTRQITISFINNAKLILLKLTARNVNLINLNKKLQISIRVAGAAKDYCSIYIPTNFDYYVSPHDSLTLPHESFKLI